MGKVKLKEIFKSDEENIDLDINGIINKNKIIYKENDIKVTIVVFSNKILMNRLHNNYEIDFIFENGKKTNVTYKLKEYNKEFKLNIITTKLVISEREISINYTLEENSFSFKLKIGGSYDN